MSNQLSGYQIYLEKCEQYGVEPISFRYFVLQLTIEQFKAFNHYVEDVYKN